MINHFLNRIDDFDKTIIEMFHQNAKISLNEIASNLNLSQPAVAARKLRLERVGIIGSGTCPDFKKIKISLFRIKVISLNPLALKKKAKKCPYIVNLFSLFGKYNYELIISAHNKKQMEIIVQNCFRSDRSIKNLSIHEIINTKKNIFFKFNYCLFMDENIYGINRCCLSSNFNEFSDCLRIDFVPIFQKIKKKSGFIPNYRIICNNFIKKNNINLIIIRFFNQFYELEVFETHSFQDNVNNVKIKKKIQMQEIFIHKAKYRLIDKISPINSQSEPFYGNEEFENNYIFCDLIENKKYGVFLEEYHKAYGYIITIQYNEKLFGILHVINFSNDKKYQDLELNNLISFSDLLSNSLFCMNLEEKS